MVEYNEFKKVMNQARENFAAMKGAGFSDEDIMAFFTSLMPHLSVFRNCNKPQLQLSVANMVKHWLRSD